ncbi:MBL fold metallo-hydrolase [Actinoallomurus sp. NBC_01490]|jgi:metallo-beta-lactamase class B|uniref:MBL fold metallo-hydrolase n=1 Tax=Actinoallomurus sp. NBC_01490 TaxID=2903557 RepID=UPI002E352CAC|nr:MBL fold metallo-hydrolase [Actinoallomurus sp. NBC_01490]
MLFEQSGPSRRAVLFAAAVLPLARGTSEASAATATSARRYYDRAARLAGKDPVLQHIVNALSPGAVPPPVKAPDPLRIFDDVAVVSTGFVSATAITTPQGVILIDALSSPDEAEKVLVSGLRAVGMDPANIKYVVVTHAHYDHFGGAQYLADRYGARVMMSQDDWDLLATDRPANAPAPDLVITNGQRLTLGDTTVELHLTPGHTPGTVSPIFPVRWNGHRHTAMLWGGTSLPAATSDKRTYLASALTFSSRMRRAGIDVELNNHGACDNGLARMEELRSGSTGSKNPFVIGEARTQRFMKVMETMVRGRIASDQEAATASAGGTPAPAQSGHACC